MIHKTEEVVAAIRDNKHTAALFLPPHTRPPFFLNLIEEFWSKIDGEVRKAPVSKNEMIAERIEETVQKKATPEDCQGWIPSLAKMIYKVQTFLLPIRNFY
ncbi:MAG: hypothetical protein EXX96DRAFT_649174 [Benjaminiella poitrasii]|nr:MAG: hypothetical protein EXX96DRAFT_649174 [Benjaminiella poitrasii]